MEFCLSIFHELVIRECRALGFSSAAIAGDSHIFRVTLADLTDSPTREAPYDDTCIPSKYTVIQWTEYTALSVSRTKYYRYSIKKYDTWSKYIQLVKSSSLYSPTTVFKEKFERA